MGKRATGGCCTYMRPPIELDREKSRRERLHFAPSISTRGGRPAGSAITNYTFPTRENELAMIGRCAGTTVLPWRARSFGGQVVRRAVVDFETKPSELLIAAKH